MRANCPIGVLCGVLVTLALAAKPGVGQAAAARQSQGPVSVEVASGRTFTAEVDPRTDSSRLWLRSTRGTIVILRPIAWERVVRVDSGGKIVSGEDFRGVVAQPAEEPGRNQDDADGGRSKTIRLHCWPSSDSASGSSTPSGPEAATAAGLGPGRRETLPVRSLAIDAWAANWDADVEMDGLVVEVRPLDANGAVVPVHGTLEVNLMGWRTDAARSQQPLLRQSRPTRLGRWTRLVRPAEFGCLGVEHRLPFQSGSLELNLQWGSSRDSYAAVHARLSVPGQGVFETTASDVRIRPYSAVRDHLQQDTGVRFFPVE